MRITTQMLNESARKAGLPLNRSSLLNYVNNGKSGNSLLNALNKNSSATDLTKKNSYEKLERTADQLSQRAEVFMETGKDSLFAKARETGDNQKIYDAAEAFVGQYNDTLSAFKNASGALNDYYNQTLRATAIENKEALESIGITVAKDGTLGINKDKMKAADIDTLERVLGGTTGFTKKAAFMAGRISDNARTNKNSASSQYSSNGALYSALASKYNFLG